MRDTFVVTGLGFLVILIGATYAFNHNAKRSQDASDTITSSPSTMATSTFSITSSAFAEGASIPSKFTCEGDQVNPPLSITGVPQNAKSLALIMHDPDVPKQLKPDGNFDHWVLFNIPATTTDIAMGMTAGTAGANGAGKNQYAGPCPPKEYEPSEHRYFFALYALDSELSLPAGASRADVEKAMEGHIVAQAQLIGKYKKK